ncbi:ATP phosphoribosyltransferase regulatory subunit, partial [Streptomyces rochei]|nr:ATP phosphoribosyltransferase regulatory subunit [Streptomyces rochei]
MPRRSGRRARWSRRSAPSTSSTASSRWRRRRWEYTDALGKFLPDQDRPNEGVFSFQDDDEQWISLRYDLTAPLARYVGERYGTDGLVLPYRSYRVGYVFRNEKPGPGRFRQFMQFDADTVGSATPAADAEICMMAADTMEALGVQ